MSVTFGPMSALPLMRYDLDSLSWRTCAATSLWDLEMSSPTFPEWGMTHAGELYELPTPVRPTVERGSSSLPTPTARDYKDAAFSPRVRDGRSHGELPDVIAHQFLPKMLPTPTAADGTKMSSNPATSARRMEKGNQASLTDIVQTQMLPPDYLLPTPRSFGAMTGEIRPRPDYHANLEEAIALLPTPRATDGTDAPANLTPSVVAILDGSAGRTARLSEMAMYPQSFSLLPTPAVNDMGGGKTIEWWDEWAPRQKSADGRPAPHGKSLHIEALRMTSLGGSMSQPSGVGKGSPDQHLAPPCPAPTEGHDSPPSLWNG